MGLKDIFSLKQHGLDMKYPDANTPAIKTVLCPVCNQVYDNCKKANVRIFIRAMLLMFLMGVSAWIIIY